MNRQEMIAYAAGFFDGEGHIRISKHSTRGSYMLQITAVQAVRNPLPIFVELFGGTISSRTGLSRGKPRALYTWQASSASAERALMELIPYLRGKQDEATLALEFRKTFRAQFGDRSKMPDAVIAQRKEMKVQLEEMRAAKIKIGYALA